jgi:predicted metalloprotease with PDZ domain
LADVELRRRSNGQQTVDTVLDQLHDCCMDPGKLWRAKDLMRKMDQLADTTVFSELYDRYAHATRFPDVEPALAALGVDTRRSSVRLRSQADEAHIRSSIMQPPPITESF